MSTELAVEAASNGVLGTLGVNWKIFIAQLVNFGVVLLILWRWVYRPVVKLLDERSKKIEESVRRAEEIETERKKLDAELVVRLRESEQKAQEIITEAMKVAEAGQSEAATKAQEEAERILKRGKEELVAQKSQMLAEARTELADLVILAVGKVLEEKMDEKQDRKLVDKVLAKIEA